MNWYIIPSQYLPVLSPAMHTKSIDSLKLLHIYARTNQYSYSFLPRPIRDWNNLNISNIDNIDLRLLSVAYSDLLKNFTEILWRFNSMHWYNFPYRY